MSLLVALSGLVLSYHLKLGIEKKLSIALARAVVQLLLLGFVLLNFLFSMNSLPLVAGYLVAMLLIAATEVINRQVRSYDGHYIDALISCTVSGGFCGIYASVVVFNPTPWWNPRVFLPSSGMIIGNSVSGPSVAVDRLLSEVTEKKHETEVRLAFGATGFEALLPTVRAATLAALMPNLNMLSIVGVVSIPGMMTGQLLGGSTPIVAAEYQMAILFLITTTTVLSTYLAVMLAIKHAVLSPEQRLTSERILKVTGPKRSIDAALIDGMYSAATIVLNTFSQRCCCLAYCAPLWTPAAETGTRASSGTGTHSAAAYSALPQSALLELPAMARSGGINPLQGTTTMVRERDEASGLEGTELDIESGRLHRATYSVRINAEVLPHGTPLLEIQHLNIKSGELLLFDQEGFTLTLHAGERIALEGNSGLGKTRLLRAMALLDDCENGVLTIYSGQRDRVHGHNGSSVAVRGKGDRAQGQVEHAPVVYAHWRSRVLYIPQVRSWKYFSVHRAAVKRLNFCVFDGVFDGVQYRRCHH
jgi:putative ABC transport system permease protein